MNKKIFLFSAIVLSILIIPISLSYAQENTESDLIPSWVKGVFGYWIEDKINDTEVIEALQFLIDSNVIQIDSVNSSSVSTSLTNEEKRLYELELNQKDDRIIILEREYNGIESNNSQLLNNMSELENNMSSLEKALKQKTKDFEQWKTDHPFKTGNIGGKLINSKTISQLEEQIQQLTESNNELEQENKKLKQKNKKLKSK